MIDFELWKHQEEGVQRALEQDNFAFLFSCGTGKSLTTIQVLRRRYAEHDQIIPTLILCPVIVVNNWKDEWEKFSKISLAKVLPLIGPTRKRIQSLENARSKYGDGLIVVTNYEALVASKEYFKALYDWHPLAMVVDESQRIKSHNSKRTKLVIELCDRAKYKYILTGTPILNSPLDIFSQFRALDGGESFGKNFFSFRATYFYDKNAGMPQHVHFPNWEIRRDSYSRLNDIIYKKAMRAKKEDCLDLPPLVKQKIYVSLSSKERKLYDEMLNHFVAVFDDNVVSADMALTRTLRLLQILNGFIKDEEGKVTSLFSPKKVALKELLSDICTHSKVLVWACFIENYNQIREVCNALKIKYVEAHGGISNKAKFAAVEQFNSDSDTMVFIGHPGSLGVGINLIAASYSIYFSRTFSLEYDIQSEARNYRGGSERHAKVTRIDLVTKDTIDEQVIEALESKLGDSEKILNMLKNKLLKR
jgi:SNF2 family DNA or RNA helicase